jgi:hypothetical protein
LNYKQTMTTPCTRRDLDLAIRRTAHSEEFCDLLMNRSQAEAGPFDGGCLIAARALIQAFGDAPGSAQLVCMVSPLNGGQVEHFGAQIGHWIADFNGTFLTPKDWIDRFAAEEHIDARLLSFHAGEPADHGIVDDPQASAQAAEILRAHWPDAPEVVRQESRAFRATALQDPDIIATRAQGLEFDLISTSEGLEIAHIGMPIPLRGQRVASKFLKRLCELADMHQAPLLLEVGTDDAEIGLSDWYERRGFHWTGKFMERMPQALELNHEQAKNRPT